ncbi:MAG TPA: marine proteobacterial sortase target protein [Desulfobulbales bacterium]|nr:marine proteobacterial sortase target protein [Desulfobulbales bacterium]
MLTANDFGNHKRQKRSFKQTLSSYWDPGVFLIAAFLVTSFIFVVLSIMFPAQAESSMLPQNETHMKPSGVREGSLLFKSVKSGQYVSAPQLNTDVKIEITGMVAYARVIQEFENPGDEWLEGVYVFPLPEDAAVSHLTMDVGDRVIEGVIKEREEAKKVYSQAKKEGKKASLLEQERPNIFMMSVANIGPHEVIKVELEYQQTVRLDNGLFSLRFPTVVGPRYIPGQQTGNENRFDEFNLSGWAFATTEVPDAPRISPPVVEPGQDPDNPVSLEVILDPGFNLAKLQSLYHAVDINYINDEVAEIRLNNTWAVADQDFVLEWAPDKGRAPQAALFAEEKKGENFIYLMVMPPAENSVTDYHIPREVIFVVDVSGSMAGPSIRQAKDALVFAVSRLQPEDRFNIITFNDIVDRFFNYPMTGTKEHIQKALHFIKRLEATGGTEIEPALYEALDGSKNLNRIRQVIFMTDGSVGNEQQLLQTVRERLGDSRIFTIGIGSAPNSYFMRNIAERGKGTFTYIGDVKEVQERMEELYTKLENPMLTDVRLSISNQAEMEMFPDPIPDLYLGEPLTLVASTENVPEQFLLSGYYAGRYWEAEIKSRTVGESDGISILWARQKIKSLMDSLDGGADQDEVRKNVLETALQHHLVSKYTSLVAVDVTPSRPEHENMNSKMAKTNMPKGWQYNKVFDLPQTATVAELCFILGALALLLSLIVWFLAARER